MITLIRRTTHSSVRTRQVVVAHRDRYTMFCSDNQAVIFALMLVFALIVLMIMKFTPDKGDGNEESGKDNASQEASKWLLRLMGLYYNILYFNPSLYYVSYPLGRIMCKKRFSRHACANDVPTIRTRS